jgi:hypothetical protein
MLLLLLLVESQVASHLLLVPDVHLLDLVSHTADALLLVVVSVGVCWEDGQSRTGLSSGRGWLWCGDCALADLRDASSRRTPQHASCRQEQHELRNAHNNTNTTVSSMAGNCVESMKAVNLETALEHDAASCGGACCCCACCACDVCDAGDAVSSCCCRLSSHCQTRSPTTTSSNQKSSPTTTTIAIGHASCASNYDGVDDRDGHHVFSLQHNTTTTTTTQIKHNTNTTATQPPHQRSAVVSSSNSHVSEESIDKSKRGVQSQQPHRQHGKAQQLTVTTNHCFGFPCHDPAPTRRRWPAVHRHCHWRAAQEQQEGSQSQP